MPEKLADKLLVWGSGFDPNAIEQAERTARLPFVEGYVALMPDAHWGMGSTVGSVIPTKGAIIPAAVGVDIGCGMIAVETDLDAVSLPDSLDALMPRIERAVPAGVGQGHGETTTAAETWFAAHPPATIFSQKQETTAARQFGSLGAGNHFFEICLDERDVVWVVLHSGSRGIGNQLAKIHIDKARKIAKHFFIPLEDPDLAYLVQDTKEFGAYIADMLWAQDYALGSREQMMNAALEKIFAFVGTGSEVHRINCHHNFTQQESHGGKNLWITRKGAIRATTDDEGVIPGSMGTRSYIVRGKGNPASFNSCAHGAGRRMSRGEARRKFTGDDLAQRMGDRVWNADRAKHLVDEIPDSYKDIDQIMADQSDLVEVKHTLRQVLNYKG